MLEQQSLFTSPQPFRIGDRIIVDPIKQTISLDNEQKTEPQLILLLTLLASEQGKTVTREKIFSSIWPGMVVTANSLNQSISKLRKLLGDDSRNPHIIVTIPRQGYALIEPVTLLNEAQVPGDEPEEISSEAESSDESGNRKRFSLFNVKGLLPLISLLICTFITYQFWPKPKTVIVVSPAPVLTKYGELPADPISYALSGFLYAGLKKSFKNESLEIHFNCATLASKGLCSEQYSYNPDKVVEIKPIIRYGPNKIKLNLLIDGEQNAFELETSELSFSYLDEELDELLINLVKRFTNEHNHKRIMSALFEWLKQPNNPALAVDRMKLAAYAYSDQVIENAVIVKQIEQSTQICNFDCPLLYGAYGRVLVHLYIKTQERQYLLNSLDYLQRGAPERLSETELTLAAAYALAGQSEKSYLMLQNIQRVSFPGLKKALQYYLAVNYLKEEADKPVLLRPDALVEYLLKSAK
ncbi:winged helix-turn-helix domain-containing protein [Psychromonas ossibalaenae]|uniref:winged helix-turn-helix domain-containing protein n=1 Tax=Psychromonas ossibalaenae TaxID=444922 RepID=UPI00037600E4|nr:winged helix-turn-helix domain-containing protein [Psychromonas ossibalaenae]